LISLLIIHLESNLFSWPVYAVFTAWFVASVLFSKLPHINQIITFSKKRLPVFGYNFLTYLNKSIIGWQSIKGDKKLLLRLNLLTINGYLILFAMTVVEFRAVGISASLASISLYVTLSALSLIISITPGSIGVREAILIFTSQLMGISSQQILAIAVIDRSAMFLVLFIGYVVLKVQGIYKNKAPDS
jgi:uncharacterized protein (TIRG00374 family)